MENKDNHLLRGISLKSERLCPKQLYLIITLAVNFAQRLTFFFSSALTVSRTCFPSLFSPSLPSPSFLFFSLPSSRCVFIRARVCVHLCATIVRLTVTTLNFTRRVIVNLRAERVALYRIFFSLCCVYDDRNGEDKKERKKERKREEG